jgi:hypothetical protein
MNGQDTLYYFLVHPAQVWGRSIGKTLRRLHNYSFHIPISQAHANSTFVLLCNAN